MKENSSDDLYKHNDTFQYTSSEAFNNNLKKSVKKEFKKSVKNETKNQIKEELKENSEVGLENNSNEELNHNSENNEINTKSKTKLEVYNENFNKIKKSNLYNLDLEELTELKNKVFEIIKEISFYPKETEFLNQLINYYNNTNNFIAKKYNKSLFNQDIELLYAKFKEAQKDNLNQNLSDGFEQLTLSEDSNKEVIQKLPYEYIIENTKDNFNKKIKFQYNKASKAKEESINYDIDIENISKKAKYLYYLIARHKQADDYFLNKISTFHPYIQKRELNDLVKELIDNNLLVKKSNFYSARVFDKNDKRLFELNHNLENLFE